MFDVYENTVFEKKNEAINLQLLVQSYRKFLCVIWNLVKKTCQKHNPKFVTLRWFFKLIKIKKKYK